MASKNKVLIKMTSTGTLPNGSPSSAYFVIRKNPKNQKLKGAGKIKMRKYDNKTRKHEIFEEKKMPSHSK